MDIVLNFVLMTCSYAVKKRDTVEFNRPNCFKYNRDKSLNLAYERALLYFDAEVLPNVWKKEHLLTSESEAENEEEDEVTSSFISSLFLSQSRL